MIGGLAMLTAAAEGAKATMPEGDQLGSDPGQRYDERRSALLAAVRHPGALDRDWEMPFGATPAQVMAGIAFMEHLVHAWDIAKATGQDTTLPADLVNECMQVVTPLEATLRASGACGPPVQLSGPASEQDELIAFMGRNP